MGFTKPIEQYLFSNSLTKIHVLMYLKDIIRGNKIMKRIVITGATSMIGVALIKEAIENNIEVLAIVRENSPRKNRLPKSNLIRIIECDIETLNKFPDMNEKYDVFYHFAWNYTDRKGRNDPKMQAQNIANTLEAVELAKRLGCQKFIGAGSQAEYGIVQEKISSDTMTNPNTPYGIAKNTAGNMSKIMCEQLDMQFVWGRIFSVYGCLDNEGTMINYAIDQFIEGKEAKFSSALQMWNYLNEKDAGKIFYLLGKSKEATGIYCIANKESMPLRKYIEIIKTTFGESAKCNFASEDLQKKKVTLDADIDKLQSDINFVPEITFEQGIKEVIEYRKTKYTRGK